MSGAEDQRLSPTDCRSFRQKASVLNEILVRLEEVFFSFFDILSELVRRFVQGDDSCFLADALTCNRRDFGLKWKLVSLTGTNGDKLGPSSGW